MHFSKASRCVAIATALSIPGGLSAQIAAGKTNNFEDGTTQGWQINLLGLGSPPPGVSPTNIGTGGPTGVDDNYLRLTSIGGSGGGSRLTALNVDWSGNWLAAGITHVRMDANNFGNSDVMLRLLFEDPMGAAPTNMAISANGVLLAAGSGWQSLEFDLFGPSGLLALFGSVDAVLTNTTVFRIVHSSTASFPGEPVIAQIGVDNITAVSTVVPEPSSMVLFAVGALTLMIVRRRTG